MITGRNLCDCLTLMGSTGNVKTLKESLNAGGTDMKQKHLQKGSEDSLHTELKIIGNQYDARK